MTKILPPLAFSAIVAAFVLALASARGDAPRLPPAKPADIGVEHGHGATVTLTLSTGKTPSILEISSQGAEPVHVSVSQAWERREVRNAALADVAAEATALGFTRWRLPPGAILSLSLPQEPAGLVIHHPTREPLGIRLKRIDLRRGTVQTDVYLLEDETLRLY